MASSTPPPVPDDLLTSNRDRQFTAKIKGVDLRVALKRKDARRRQWTADLMVVVFFGYLLYGMGCVRGWW